jgi:hypothetical protein
MANHDWTRDRVALLRQLWDQGLTVVEIGRRMGLNKNQVIGKKGRLQLPCRAAQRDAARRWTEADDVTLRRLYGGLMTAAEIASRMGRSKGAIAHRAAKLGLSAERRALPRSRGMVPQPAARSSRELPVSGARAASPSRPRAATRCSGYRVTRAVTQPGAAATTALCFSSLNSPEAVAETSPPRVFSGTKCCYPVGDLTCDEPVRANARGLKSSYCPEHFALIYAAPPAKSANNPPPATWLKNRGVIWARG